MPDTFQTRYGKQHLKEWQARHMKTVELLEVFNTSRGKTLVVKSEDEIRKGDVIEESGNVYRVESIMFPTVPCSDERFAIVVSPAVLQRSVLKEYAGNDSLVKTERESWRQDNCPKMR